MSAIPRPARPSPMKGKGRPHLMMPTPVTVTLHPSFVEVVSAIRDGAYGQSQLMQLKSEAEAARSKQHKYAQIIAVATIDVGTRVRINDQYSYKSLWGLEGVVVSVTGGTVWVTADVRLDRPPKRLPKYAATSMYGADCIRVTGSHLDIIGGA